MGGPPRQLRSPDPLSIVFADGGRVDLQAPLPTPFRIVRAREVLELPRLGANVALTVRGAEQPAELSFAASTVLVLDPGEKAGRRTVGEYSQALEVGTLVDVLVAVDEMVSGIGFWASVKYDNPRDTGSIKPDASFALRLAHAAKAERMVAADLNARGHEITGAAIHPPPYIVLIGRHLGGHRAGKPDLVCTRCGTGFEVKSRPYDDHLRVSSSSLRPFTAENAPDGFQAFVLRHSRVQYFSNRDIASWVRTQTAVDAGYDRFVELPPAWAREHAQPTAGLVCPSSV